MATLQSSGSSLAKKTLVLIRHGQATHNYVRDVTQDTVHYLDPSFTDCPLTDLGYSQSTTLQSTVEVPELLVVSPLERTLQTALTIFGPHLDQMGNGKKIPIIALECVREVAGKHLPDKRVAISDKIPRYPAVDFSSIAEDEDVLWKPEAREAPESVQVRITEFLKWISARPETNITVVTHHAFLRNLWKFLTGAEELFANCQLRTMEIDPTLYLNN